MSSITLNNRNSMLKVIIDKSGSTCEVISRNVGIQDPILQECGSLTPHSPGVQNGDPGEWGARLPHSTILDECTTLWGEPERMYMQNVEQLHVSSECN